MIVEMPGHPNGAKAGDFKAGDETATNSSIALTTKMIPWTSLRTVALVAAF